MAHRRGGSWNRAAALALALGGALGEVASGQSLPPALAPVIERALPDADPAAWRDGRQLFEAVLESELFLHGSTGPFDVYLLTDDTSRARKKGQGLLDDLVEGLQPAGELVERLWPAGGEGLISATRLPLVVCDGAVDGVGFRELLALLDHCETQGYSGWAPANAVDTPGARTAEVVRTWEVQLFDLTHETLAARRKPFLEHGAGYYSLAFVANRALRRGAWGMVPPWLANGFIDELDLEAYGQAWVGQESFVQQTPGWFRPGWSGFVPQGHRPPPPVVGPPKNLGVTVLSTGDPWLSFKQSADRHWTTLVADRKSEAPASFVAAAQAESFLPRDRAAARCLLFLMLRSAQAEGAPSLPALLDREVQVPRHGMPDSEPLPVLFARALGGVPEVDRLEALGTRELLIELERPDLIEMFESLGAADALALSDHREQSQWLSRHRCDQDTRNALFNAILEVEWAQQFAEWKALSPRLDQGLVGALAASKKYPRRERDLEGVVTAFRAGISRDPAEVAAENASKGGKSSKKTSSRSRKSSRRR